MPVSFNDGAAWRTAVDLWANAAGTWQRVKQAYRNDGTAWRLVHQISTAPPGTPGSPALAVTASPSSYSAARNSNAVAGSFSQAFTATPSGGSGAYSGSWARIAVGSTAATSSGTGTTALTLSGSWARHATVEYSETWRYTATDSLGATATFDITLYVSVGDNT